MSTAIMGFEPGYPLSSMQQSMVIASLRAPGSGVYVLQVVCSFQEAVDRLCLQEAWQSVVEKHGMLSSTIHIQADGIIQLVRSVVNAPWTDIDWSDLTPEQQDLKLADFVRVDWMHGFDFDSGPPHRAVLIRRSDCHYQFIWTCHHCLVDRRAIIFVVRDLLLCYDTLISGGHLASEPLPPPFTDHLEWLYRQDWARAESFWHEYLKDFREPVHLPFDKGGRTEKSAKEVYSKRTLSLSDCLTADLEALAEREHITINTLVQGAWAILLSRYSGNNDVIFGATRACRRSSVPGAESIVGPLLNTIPLRVRVDPDATVTSWLQDLRVQWVTVRGFEHTPLPLVHSWSELPRGTRLFESIIVFDRTSLNAMLHNFGDGWHHRSVEILQRSDSPLTLFGHSEPLIELGIAFDQHRFETQTIERMLGHLQTLLEEMADRPESRLSNLKLVTNQEQYQILHDWNDTDRDYPLHLRAQHFFEEQARIRPEHAALIDGHRTISYEKLDAQSNQMARRLSQEGLATEQLVGILLDRRAEVVIAMLGILKAGGAFFLIDPESPRLRVRHILNDTQASLVITTPALFQQLDQHHVKPVWLDDERIANGVELEGNMPPAISSDNLAYAVYTSGSTGNPKATLITHRSLVNHTLTSGEQHSITPNDRRLQLASISSDVFIAEVFNYLSFGATLVFGLRLASAGISEFLRFVDENRITIVGMPSSYWHEWVSTMRDGEPAIPSSLRRVISGMEEVHAASLNLWQRKVGARLSWCNVYGPSETTGTATLYSLSLDETPRQAVPIGKPLANTRVYLLDPTQNLVPVGIPGEIYIGGEGVGRGYLNQPELTLAKFIADPFSNHKEARLYRTGDMGVWLHDGNIVFLGRVDHQVKIRGYRIELGEIESILGQYPGAIETLVTIREDQPGDKRLVAYLKHPQNIRPNVNAIRYFLKERLPEYMVPSAFVLLDKFPLTPNGKINRQALSAPEQTSPENEQAYVSPRSPIEEILAVIWQEVLHVARIGIHDNFFELGGHSLLAVHLIGRINKQFQIELPLYLLFEAPTVAELSVTLETKLKQKIPNTKTPKTKTFIKALDRKPYQNK